MKETPSGLNIRAVAERTGIPLHTLRAWERRYGVPRPARVPGNKYRVYDEQDVADVLWIKRQVESGVSPARASALLQKQDRNLPIATGAPAQPIALRRQALTESLLAYDEQAAQQVLDEAWALYSPEQMTLQLVQPAMAAIGAGWLEGRITVGQEHFATHLLRQRLLTVVQSQPLLPQSAPAVIAACAPAEQHEIGLLLFALLARRSGMRVLYLGPQMPVSELGLETDHIKRIALSVSTVRGLASLIPLWRESDRPRATLLFGGMLLNQVPQLREHLPGAFLGADAVEAVRTLTTREVSGARWAPEDDALRAAVFLGENRSSLLHLILGEDSIRAELAVDGSPVSPAEMLIDAPAAALAFGTPELVDEQARWIRQFDKGRGIDPAIRQDQLKRFGAACRRRLPREHAALVEPLLERMRARTREGESVLARSSG